MLISAAMAQHFLMLMDHSGVQEASLGTWERLHSACCVLALLCTIDNTSGCTAVSVPGRQVHGCNNRHTAVQELSYSVCKQSERPAHTPLNTLPLPLGTSLCLHRRRLSFMQDAAEAWQLRSQPSLCAQHTQRHCAAHTGAASSSRVSRGGRVLRGVDARVAGGARVAAAQQQQLPTTISTGGCS